MAGGRPDRLAITVAKTLSMNDKADYSHKHNSSSNNKNDNDNNKHDSRHRTLVTSEHE